MHIRIRPLFIAFVFAPAALLGSSLAAADNARSSVDWPGYYVGTVPCASCEGIKTVLELSDNGKRTRYTLVETYLQDQPDVFRSSGPAQWHKDGTRLLLKGKDERRMLFVSEGFVEFVDEDGKTQGKPGSSPYTLRKMDAFSGIGQQLLVDPAAVKPQGSGRDKRVGFPALINFARTTEGGHRSLNARIVLNCAGKTYEMPEVSYHAQPFGAGKLLHSEKANTNGPQPFAGKNDPMAQAADAYCGR